MRRISNTAWEDHSLEISKQAIDNRFSFSCVDFVKELLKESLASQITTTLCPLELQLFRTVRIKDSTTFGIQDSFSDLFEGYGKGGGPSSKAGLSIQYEFDIKTNKIFDIDLQSAISRDSRDAMAKKDDIHEGDLIVRDLGYYSDEVLEQVIKKRAFLISRLYQTVRVFNDKGKQIDFHEIYRQMMRSNLHSLDMNVTIGVNKRPVRLIIELLPENIYQKRLKLRKRKNKFKGYNISDEFKGRAHFNLFICNIPQTDCSWETISKLYRIRWQIELVFKIWKSILHIDRTCKMSKERFLTSLYVKLLWIFINWKIISDCRNYYYLTQCKLISLTKCFQTINENCQKLRRALSNIVYLEEFLLEIIQKLQKGYWIEKRNNRQNIEEIIGLIFCKSNI